MKSYNNFYLENLNINNYNNFYYLVLKLDDRTFSGLKKFKFENIHSISDNIKIINSFFDVRDVLLVMKKSKVEENNKLEKINYNNKDYIVKDNFKVLKRLYQVDLDYPIKSLIYQGFRKVKSTTNFYKKSKNNHSFSKRIFYLHKKIFTTPKLKSLYLLMDNNTYKIFNFEDVKNFSDLVDKTFNNINDYSKTEISIILEYIVVGFANLFINEGEVFLKDKILNIPENSYLFLKSQNPDSYTYTKKTPVINIWAKKLKNLYNIKILDYKHGKYISNTHLQVLPIIRNLHNIKNSFFV